MIGTPAPVSLVANTVSGAGEAGIPDVVVVVVVVVVVDVVVVLVAFEFVATSMTGSVMTTDAGLVPLRSSLPTFSPAAFFRKRFSPIVLGATTYRRNIKTMVIHVIL